LALQPLGFEREGGLGEHDAQQPVVLGRQMATGQGEHPLLAERLSDIGVIGGVGTGEPKAASTCQRPSSRRNTAAHWAPKVPPSPSTPSHELSAPRSILHRSITSTGGQDKG
jgi:hypothetical protein